MIVRRTTPEESKRVNEIFAVAFEMPLRNSPANPENTRIRHWAAFSENGGEMMSAISVSEYQIQFDGSSCKMGGMGGVSTLPQYRRMGGIRGCFEAALKDMYAEGYTFSYLYPFSTNYYRKFGYENCVQKYDCAVHLGLLNPPKVDGALFLAEENRPMTEDIRAIDQVWEQKYNMMVLHEEADYDWTKKLDPAVQQEFTYVWRNEAGVPKAYTTFCLANQPDGRNLTCSRFYFVDKEGFGGLMQLFKSLSADHMYVKFALPVTAAMQYLMPEWSLGAAQWHVRPAGMVRVVNVREALEKAKYRGNGEITLAVQDPQIPENDRCWYVAFANGRAVSVAETGEKPDGVFTIPTFSALLAGVADFEEAAQWFDGLEIRNPQACFEQVFYRKPLMIVDHF